VNAGLWGDPDLQLPTALSLLKQTPHNPHLRLIAEKLADLGPADDITAKMWASPETLLWWEDLVELLPSPNSYSSSVLPYVRSLKAAITSKTLSIGHFQGLRRFLPEQLSAFLRLLRIEHVNELAEDLNAVLGKAWEGIDLHTAQLERIYSTLQARRSEIRDYEALLGAAKEQFECFYSIPLQHYALPTALRVLLELPEQSQTVPSLTRLFPTITHLPHVLPIPSSEVLAYAQPTCLLSEYEKSAYLQRVLLRLSFPQVLLCTELQEGYEDLAQDWQLQHQLSFPAYLQEAFLDRMEGRVCVFTRDMRDTQLRLGIENIREKASGLSTVEELNCSLEAFLQSPSQHIYVLDCFLDGPQSDNWEMGRKALETVSLPLAGKLLCLLLRLPSHCPALPGPWHRTWRLISMESLADAFSPSLERLQLWLQRDTSDLLLDSEFLQTTGRVETILESAYSHISTDSSDEIRDLARNDDFRSLLNERIRLQARNLPDWKEPALRCSTETCLEAAVEKVLTAQAVSLLTPVIAVAKSLQAFSSFLLSPADSLARRLWKATFLQLAEDAVGPAQPVVTLHYPFILMDYHRFLLSATPLTAFHELSVTNLHLRTSRSSLSLLHQYMEDLMTLDLAKASYEWQGRKLLESLCAESKTFEEAVGRYCEHRELVLALCKAERLLLLDHFFEELLGELPGKPLRKSKSELVEILENQREELYFFQDHSSRLYAIGDHGLLAFSCLRKRVVRLPSTVEPKQSSLLLLGLASLFCCGGRITRWLSMRDYCANNTYLLTLPKGVSPQTPMLQARSYHGLALCQQEVYAIGGVDDLDSVYRCEKFSLDAGRWLDLPQQLAYARSNFTPLVYKAKIYVFGGMCEIGEVIDAVSNCISTLPISLPGCTTCISLLTESKQALVLGETRGWEVDLDSLRCRERPGGATLCSSCCPVLYKGEVVWVDKDCTFHWLSLSGKGKGSLKQPS